MYESLKALLLPLLKLDSAEPRPLPGHDLGGGIQVIRPTRAWLHYRLLWVFVLSAVIIPVSLVGGVLLAAYVDWRFVIVVLLLWAVVAFKLAIIYVTTRLDYDMRWYMLTDRSMLIRQGAWYVKEVCLTYANAQNVRITQGPLQRVFGFWNVEIETAGGGGGGDPQKGTPDTHKAVLPGLDHPYEVRDAILEHLRRSKSAGLGDHDDVGEPASPAVIDTALLRQIHDEARLLRTAMTQRQATDGSAEARRS